MRFMTLIPAAAALSTALVSAALADYHVTPGAACHGENAAEEAPLIHNGWGVHNDHATLPAIVHCPVVYANHDAGLDQVQVEYWDRSPQDSLICRVEVATAAGHLYATTDVYSCSKDGGCSYQDRTPGFSDTANKRKVMTLYVFFQDLIGQFNGRTVRCYLPARWSGWYSGVSVIVNRDT